MQTFAELTRFELHEDIHCLSGKLVPCSLVVFMLMLDNGHRFRLADGGKLRCGKFRMWDCMHSECDAQVVTEQLDTKGFVQIVEILRILPNESPHNHLPADDVTYL